MEIVHTSWVEAPIGSFRIASTQRGLAYVELPHASGRGLDGWLRQRAPDARCEPGDEPNRAAATQILEYLEGERTEFDLPLDLRGTPFQRRVWDALLEIPYGETVSYGTLARRLGRPSAARAVGAANGRNPISIVIPCHRVIGRSGDLTGYAGGVGIKKALLELERSA